MKTITLALAFLLTGCAVQENTTPQSPVCDVHKVLLIWKTGYLPSVGTMADPTMDYVDFSSRVQTLYPNTTPWNFTEVPSFGWSKKDRVAVCPRCDFEFEDAYKAHLKRKAEHAGASDGDKPRY